jgi:protein SCO1
MCARASIPLVLCGFLINEPQSARGIEHKDHTAEFILRAADRKSVMQRIYHRCLVSWSCGLLVLLCLLHSHAGAQEPKTLIGIDEKLGQNIPLDLSFYDEDANMVTLKEVIGGKPTLLLLVFYECQGICTPLLNGVAEVVRRAPELRLGEDFRIITISFDPEDTPAVARGKRENYLKLIDRPVDPGAWRFLTGNQETIDKVCDAVGFRYVKQDGAFVHVGVITVLSPEGRIARYLDAGNMVGNVIPFLPFEIQMALSEASNGQVGSTVHKVLQLCFQYDPEGKRYALNITRMIMVIILLFAGMLLLYVTMFSKIKPEQSEAEIKKE